MEYKTETNKLKRAWIWFWYNDITRLLIIFGVPSLLLVFVAYCAFVPSEYLGMIAGGSYLLLFSWGLLDNDYSNLRRIGLNEYRQKLRPRQNNS